VLLKRYLPLIEQEGKWIGVDLDGTLAQYDEWQGVEHIGAPVEKMKALVLDLIAQGKTVKIFTARAAGPTAPMAKKYIRLWLQRNGFPDLEVTNVKDQQMETLYDDRAIQVEPNTGNLVESYRPLFEVTKSVPFGSTPRFRKPTTFTSIFNTDETCWQDHLVFPPDEYRESNKK
jgi:hypothetical protein